MSYSANTLSGIMAAAAAAAAGVWVCVGVAPQVAENGAGMHAHKINNEKEHLRFMLLKIEIKPPVGGAQPWLSMCCFCL